MNENQDFINRLQKSNHNLKNKMEDRRKLERRVKPSKGFCQISVVGWIDRRERCRRKDDKIV